MKKILFITIFLFSRYSSSQGQDISKPNVVYVEALGNGLFGSVSYERELFGPFRGRVGVGYYRSIGYDFVTLPLGFYYSKQIGRDPNFIDVGMGVTFAKRVGSDFFDKLETDYFLVKYIPSIAYRRYLGDSWFLRASISPVIGKFKNDFVLSGGLAIGKRF